MVCGFFFFLPFSFLLPSLLFLSLFLLLVSNKFIFLTVHMQTFYSCFMDKRFVQVTSCKLSIGDANDARFLSGPGNAFSLPHASRFGFCSRYLVSFHCPLLPGPHLPTISLCEDQNGDIALNKYTHLSNSVTQNRM